MSDPVDSILKGMAGLVVGNTRSQSQTQSTDAPVEVSGAPLSEGASTGEESERRRRQLYFLYSVVSKAMPTEGRDFTMEVTFGGPEGVTLSGGGEGPSSVKLRPLTEIGKHFCTHLAKVLREELEAAHMSDGSNVPGGSDGAAGQ